MRGADLYRAIFQSDSPEEFVKVLSPQMVYLAIQGYGLESSMDLLQIVPDRYYQTFLDLQFWEKDSFSEEAFWRWLKAIDQEDSLSPLQQFMRGLDPKVLAQVVGRYVHAIIGDEKAEAPPAEGYYTPDQGYTWVSFNLEDETQLRLLGRLFALIYQMAPDYFYQVLNMSSGSSSVELEEEAFQEKTRRLANEGLPDLETSVRMHTPIDRAAFRGLLVKGERFVIEGNPAFAAVLYSDHRLEPLSSLFEVLEKDDQFRSEIESELTLLVNAAILRFLGTLADPENVERQIAQVRGILNIGLEQAIKESKGSGEQIVRSLGLQPLYRLGLGELRDLRRRVREYLEKQVVDAGDEGVRLVSEGILNGEIPLLLDGLSSDGGVTRPEGEVVRYQEFRSHRDIEAVESCFRKFSH